MQILLAFALAVASYSLSAILKPKVQPPTAATFDDFNFPQAEEGSPQTVFFGDNWTSDWQVLWYGGLRSQAIKAEGGKK